VSLKAQHLLADAIGGIRAPKTGISATCSDCLAKQGKLHDVQPKKLTSAYKRRG
jgi:hypothetical protein